MALEAFVTPNQSLIALPLLCVTAMSNAIPPVSMHREIFHSMLFHVKHRKPIQHHHCLDEVAPEVTMPVVYG